jgi:hypothetical protein
MQASADGAAAGMRRLGSAMILAAAISFVLASSARAGAGNLRIATDGGPLLVYGPFVAFTRASLGSAAGNVQLFDARTRQLRDLGVPGFAVLLRGRLLVVGVPEQAPPDAIGRDLNGDADTDDFVIHVFDTARGTLRNLGFVCCDVYDLGDSFPGRLAFSVPESSQGGRDLNGDGDDDDLVLHVFELRTGAVTNTGLAVPTSVERAVAAAGQRLVASVRESSQGNVDLNGDGDTDDAVVHVFDSARGRAVNLGLAEDANAFLFQVGAGVALVPVPEANQRADLNRDGDREDVVLQRVVLGSNRIQNSALAISVENLELDPAAEVAAFAVREADQGCTDLNGDGDCSDLVAHFLATRTGAVRSSQLSIGEGGLDLAQGGRAVLAADEPGVARDLNGDGDLGDAVVQVIDARTLSVLNTRLALPSSATTGFAGRLDAIPPGARSADPYPLLVSERQQGRDLNGDGDAGGTEVVPGVGIDDDLVLHFVSLRTGAAVNSRLDGLGLLVPALGPARDLRPARGRFVVPVLVPRPAPGLNGGTIDAQLTIFDTRTRATQNLGLFAVTTFIPFPLLRVVPGDGLFSVGAEELVQMADLNGDGDQEDFVVQLVDIATGSITNTRRAVFRDDPLPTPDIGRQRLGDAFAFLASEQDQGMDLNGDGDSVDLVVHAALLTDRDRDGLFDFADACVGRASRCAGE